MNRWTRPIPNIWNSCNYPENGQHQIWQNHVCSGKDFSTFVQQFWKFHTIRCKWVHLWSGFRTVLNNSQPIVQKLSPKSGSWSRTGMLFWANDMDRTALDNLHKHLEGDVNPRETSPLWIESPKSLVQHIFWAPIPLHGRNKDSLVDQAIKWKLKGCIIHIKTKQSNE